MSISFFGGNRENSNTDMSSRGLRKDGTYLLKVPKVLFLEVSNVLEGDKGTLAAMMRSRQHLKSIANMLLIFDKSSSRLAFLVVTTRGRASRGYIPSTTTTSFDLRPGLVESLTTASLARASSPNTTLCTMGV
jgi:hypothetical protein